MTWILRKDGVKVAESGGWNPVMFGHKTGTSFPTSVTAGWTWEQDGYELLCEADLPPEPQTAEQLLQQAQAYRAEAYKEEADSLFFQEQRGEVSSGTWLAKVAEIKARYPLP